MNTDPATVEPQYGIVYEVERKHGRSKFGLMANESWNQDPKRTLFTLARYKFVAKMLSGYNKVLEVGCADAFGTRIVQQSVGEVTATDIDPAFIKDIDQRYDPNWPLRYFVHNLLDGPLELKYDAAYCLDVLEHIKPEHELLFLDNMTNSIKDDGVLIVGIPSLESQIWASPQSKEGHVNCQSGEEFKASLKRFFDNVFVFSMNDEVVHTGFYPMSHYLLALCCGKSRS
jgi:2-polyprenyl-3-methyl-5-hydroxy-6-metoxy-1,4-benzoquinol methylase